MSKQQDQQPRKRVVRGSQTQLPEAPAQRAEMEARRAAAKKRKKAKTPVPLRGIAWVVRSIFKVLAIVVLVCVIAGCIGGTALTIFVMKYVDNESGYDLENMETTYTSNLYAKDGDGKDVIIRSLAANGRRDWLEIEKISTTVQHAIISAEDERFYEHEGVDWMRTFAAFANMAFQMVTGSEKEFFSGGASTITQQLIKNINGDFADDTRTPATKMKEILAALNLEKNFTKQQILEGYINYISMGHSNYGIQAGAQYYFGKDAANLTIVEAASLAAVTKSPSGLNPADAPKDNKSRRDWILGVMRKNEFITEEEYQDAKKATVKTIDYTSDDDEEEDDIFTYFEDAVLVEVINDLMEKYDYSYETAKGKVMGGGMQIYSTLDLKLQERLEDEFEIYDNFNDWEPEDPPDAMMTIMDYQGHMVAMQSGFDRKTTNLSFNPITQGGIWMGSCMKPISAYAPAWDQDLIYWSQIRKDEPKIDDDGDGKLDWPNNFGNTYTGNIPIIHALRQSHNTIPVELAMDMGLNEVNHWMKDTLHLSTVDMVKDYYSSVLGSNTNGVHLSEFTAAFTMFGNGGFYTPPTTYTKVLDATGKVLLESDTVFEQVISKQTSFIMNRALREVITSGTGTAASMDDYGIEVVGKTGTTEEFSRSFIGLTPYHVASIWYGDLTNLTSNLNQSHMYSPTRVWRNIMKDIYDGFEDADFEMDDEGVSQRAYCRSTGLLAGRNCSTAYGYFKDDVPLPTCSGSH